MNRIIKFRGVTSKGKTIYGFAFQYRGEKTWNILDENMDVWKINRAGVSQLIATDINGNEIYEGDFCTCKAAVMNPFQATFDHFSAIRDGKIILEA